MDSVGVVYMIVNNIPKSYHAADLRNFFSQFTETAGFSCFHFRHRPEIQEHKSNAKNLDNLPEANSLPSAKRCVTTCCVIKVYRNRVEELLEMYNRKFWVDREGYTMNSTCFIQPISLSDKYEQSSNHGCNILKNRAESKTKSQDHKTFTKDDLASMIEMHPPPFMPNGNVGTLTKHFLEQIRACCLPPSIITRLGLEFPRSRGKRLYGSVPFDYGNFTEKKSSSSEEMKLVFTAKGNLLSKEYEISLAAGKKNRNKDELNEKLEDEHIAEDDSEEEEWDRHASLHNDITQQERLKERLFEEKIELKWEKGGSGLVFYTDAQFWDEKEGDFDAKTADDWDIDMSEYYEPGTGDKDARDYVKMRFEERLRLGVSLDLSDGDDVSNFGAFERHTKGFGRKVLEAQGWKQGEGIGKTVVGIAEPVAERGQNPHDKKGLGYRGVKLCREPYARRRKRHRPSYSDEDRVFISTAYDNPLETDPPEPLLRSSFLTRLKYRKEFLKESC